MKKLALALLLVASAASATTYTIDPVHSAVTFRIRHIVTKVNGRFTKFSGSYEYVAGKPASWKGEAKIDPASITTDNERRDGHLKSPDFFDVAKCPEMGFVSTKVHDVKDNTAKVDGNLTMHCATKPVTLDAEITEPMGTEMGVELKTKLNRKDWGIIWNKTMDKGGAMLGDDVDVTISLAASAKEKAAK
jgi:polyisoprenoid-binding protein YceI